MSNFVETRGQSKSDGLKRPLLRWAGSKRRLLPRLKRLSGIAPKHYIEPFAGSAALFFEITPEAAALGDLNADVINLLNSVKCRPEETFEHYSNLAESEVDYYNIREKFNCTPLCTERAAMMLHLNRLCFNGIYRVNASGRYNVPFGGKRSLKPISREEFLRAHAALQIAEIGVGDFDVTVRSSLSSETLVYLDPPYFTKSTRVFNEYNTTQFSSPDLYRLDLLLNDIDKAGARFILSYADVPEIMTISSKWSSVEFGTVRHIAGFQSRKRQSKEIIVSNFEIKDHE